MAGTTKVQPPGINTFKALDSLRVVNDRLFFYAHDGIHGNEPWVSDGTGVGTTMLADINPGLPSSAISTSAITFLAAPVGGKLYFIADDGAAHNGLWSTDGTSNGTRLVKDLLPGKPSVGASFPVWTSLESVIYFIYITPQNLYGLWRSDGTPQGTSLLLSQGFTNRPPGLAAFAGGIYLPIATASPGVTANTLYRYDPATGILAAIRSFAAGDDSPGTPTAMPDGVYFSAVTAQTGDEMWKTDGTAAGTMLVADATPGAASSSSSVSPGNAVAFHGAVWFPVAAQLWVTPDIIPPEVTAASLAAPMAAPVAVFQFTEDLGISITADDFELRDLATGALATGASLYVAYDATTFRATVTCTGAGNTVLSDGNFRLTLRSGSVADGAGNSLAADYSVDFFVLGGDANHDRSVDFLDLAKLAQNYNTSGGKTYADADFNGDGNVDFLDLAILAQRYNASLPGAAQPVAASSTSFSADWAMATGSVTAPVVAKADPKKDKPKPVFSVAPVVKPVPPKPKALPQRRR